MEREGMREDSGVREHEEISEAELEGAAPAAAPAGAPREQQVLALQRTVGNRAVTQMLSREGTVGATTDARIGYRGEGEADTPGLDARALPYNDRQHPL